VLLCRYSSLFGADREPFSINTLRDQFAESVIR
jgi:hypothetical protein